MNARIATATRLGFREQARRPFLIELLVVVPFVFITKAIASTEAIPRRIGLPGGGESSSFHAWGYLAVALGWLAVLIGAVALVLRRLLHQRS